MSSMSISHNTSSASTLSSGSEDSATDYFHLQICEVTKSVFITNFENCDEISLDDFEYSGPPPNPGEIPSYNSLAIGDCITMFGIGVDGSLFVWRSSPLTKDSSRIDKEIILRELTNCFSYYHESVRNLQFDIYLLGGNGSELSNNLYEGMVAAIPEFFINPIIADQFINPTQFTGKTFISANFNAKGEFHYYLHNKISH